jgi:hypothetical protein
VGSITKVTPSDVELGRKCAAKCGGFEWDVSNLGRLKLMSWNWIVVEKLCNQMSYLCVYYSSQYVKLHPGPHCSMRHTGPYGALISTFNDARLRPREFPQITTVQQANKYQDTFAEFQYNLTHKGYSLQTKSKTITACLQYEVCCPFNPYVGLISNLCANALSLSLALKWVLTVSPEPSKLP